MSTLKEFERCQKHYGGLSYWCLLPYYHQSKQFKFLDQLQLSLLTIRIVFVPLQVSFLFCNLTAVKGVLIFAFIKMEE